MVKEEVEKSRPEALAHIRHAFQELETGFLADGRQWILGDSEGPTLADIEGLWPFQWLADTSEALPEQYVSQSLFPKTYAWIHRF